MAGWRAALLLAAVVVTAMAVGARADACSKIADTLNNGGVVLNQQAFACLKSIPYNKTVADEIITTMYRTFALHAYIDISKDSPTPEYPVKIDVLTRLTEIANTTYKSDFAFNVAVYNVINALNDGHAYYQPNCYYTFEHWNAFPLISVLQQGRSVVKISPNVGLPGLIPDPVLNATESIMGINTSDYAGALVHTINGISALSYARKVAYYGGTYKDLNTRINTIYSRFNGIDFFYRGNFAISYSLYAPSAANVTLTVQRKNSTLIETLVIPYLVLSDAINFVNTADYYASNCVNPAYLPQGGQGSKPKSAKSKFVPKGVIPRREPRYRVPANSQPIKTLKPGKNGKLPPARAQSGVATVYQLVASYVSTYLLSDLQTGVMVVPDMEGFNGDYVSFQNDVYNGITALKFYQASRLIIDVQDNPGGFVDIAYALLEFLFPSQNNIAYPIQNPAPPLVQRLVNAANVVTQDATNAINAFTQYDWFGDNDVKYNLFTSSAGYFYPLEELTFADTPGNYSNLYHFLERLAPPFGLNVLIPQVGDLNDKFAPNETIILSNGGCYSTCSIFSYLMQEVVGVKIVSVGGQLGKSMSYSAGTVGYSYSLDSLLSGDIDYLGLATDKDAPNALPVLASVGYTAAQAYCHENSTIPADFVYKPADIRFPFTDHTVVNIVNTWEQVATYFP